MARQGGKYKGGELVDPLTKPAKPKDKAGESPSVPARPEKARNKEVRNV